MFLTQLSELLAGFLGALVALLNDLFAFVGL